MPVLGICYGMQTMAAQLGGGVENGKVREFGYAEVRARGHSKLLEGIQDRAGANGEGYLDVWMSHGDKVTALPPGFKLMASNEACPIAGMADEARALLRGAVPSRGHAHQAGHARSTRASCTRSAARAAHWNMPRVRAAGDRSASASRSAATR